MRFHPTYHTNQLDCDTTIICSWLIKFNRLIQLAKTDIGLDSNIGQSAILVKFVITIRDKMVTNINRIILDNIKLIEMVGVLMRIFSFSLVSWLGPQSPFLFVWIFNTTDAIILSWCSMLKKDNAYITLNIFWVMIGIIGILRAGNILR